MASTYSNLKIQLMATGENTTTWGNVTNTNLGTALEEAIVGSADVTFVSNNQTLTLADTNATQTARNMRLLCGGTTGGSTRNLVVPAIEKPYIIQNTCGDSIIVKTPSGSGITVPAGKTMWVYNNGTDVVDAVTHLTSLTLASPLPIASGGTGGNTAANARTSLELGTIATQNSSNVTITGGNVTGITDLAVADGGTGASTNSAARVNLLPSYTGNNSKILALNSGATDVEWVAAGGNGTVTSVAALTLGTAGTDLASTVANSTTTPVITLNVPTASAANRGALSSADWSTFNSKAASGANTDITALDQDVTITATGTIAANTLGYRGLPQSTNTTLTSADAGKHIYTASNITIPPNSGGGSVAFPVGTTIVLVNSGNATRTVSLASDTLRIAGSTTSGSPRTLAVYGMATIVKVATTEWYISGTVT